MGAVAALILIGAFVAGFLIVGKWVDNIFAQLLLGALMGMAIMAGIACVLMGVAFAGCLLMSGGNMNMK